MKILALAAIAFVLSLPAGVRKQTQSRKKEIQRLADRLGISNLFNLFTLSDNSYLVVRKLTYITHKMKMLGYQKERS